MTFYCLDFASRTFVYYDHVTSAWIYTGDTTPHYNPNLASGGGFIYLLSNIDEGVYKYNGTGNATYLTTVSHVSATGPVDLVADCQGNFYILCNTSTESFFRKYSPSGALLQSWTISNPNNIVAYGGGGLSVLGNNLYYDLPFIGGTRSKIVSCTVGSASISIDSVTTGSTLFAEDMGSCAGFGLSLPTITVTPSGNNVCAGTPVTFTASSTLGGNAPKYQWRVNNAKVGANDTSYTYVPGNGDTVTCTMMSSSYCVSQVEVTNAPVVMHVLPIVTPAVTIRASDTGIICPGAAISFIATPVNGGSAPTYQWQKNGTPVGGVTPGSYSTTTLANNDTIRAVMLSNAACTSVPSAISNLIVARIGIPTPSVSLSISPAGIICSGTQVTLNASGSYGGGSPTYQWMRNGVLLSTTFANPHYTTSALNNNDTLSVAMTSGIPCANPQQVTSNAIVVSVKQTVIPGINVNILPGIILCSGTTVTYVSNIAGGGSGPQYQWYKNGVAVSGANLYTYTRSGIITGDTLSALLTSSETCAQPPAILSNKVGMTMLPVVSPGISISALPGLSIAPGQRIIFRAIFLNGGPQPKFQWTRNGADIPFATDSTYSSSALADGDRISVRMISSDPCPDNAQVIAAAVIVRIGEGLSTASAKDGWVLYPNPTSGRFFIVSDNKLAGRYAVRDIAGQMVCSGDVDGSKTEVVLQQGLSAGLLFYRDQIAGWIYPRKDVE